MDDGSDDFYRGLMSADAFRALMSRHLWNAPAPKLERVPGTILPLWDAVLTPFSGATRNASSFIATSSLAASSLSSGTLGSSSF
jgi:hypothetical protein